MLSSKLTRIVLVSVVWLLTGLSTAQAQKDAQSVYEPQSKPGVGQKFLQRFAGDWDVAKAFYPPRGGEAVHMRGTCRQRMIHGGRFLQSDFVFRDGNRQTTGLGIIGFDPATGLFTSVWTDSRSTRMSLRHSREPFNGKEIYLYSASLDRGKAPAWKSRTITRLLSDGNKIVHRQYAVGRDGKERLMMELVLTRKATAGKRQ